MTRRAALVSLSVLASAHLLTAQQQELPTFRIGVEAVQFDAIVTDADGNPVTDLTADDFEIVENGMPQPITTFAFVNIPIERPLGPVDTWQVRPDVLSNDGPEGRVYLIALEPVAPEWALRARAILRRFLEEHFQPNDLAAVVLTHRGLVTDGQDFTSDPHLLLAAIEKYSGGGLGSGARTDRLDRVESLRHLTEALARMPGGRKALIYVTARPPFDAYDVVDYRPGPLSLWWGGDDAHDAIAAATRNNIAIYPIHPAGLTPDELTLDVRMDFEAIAEVTGGFALVDSNSFMETFERIARENSTYYVLGFNSSYTRRDGRYVRVEVRVTRPGLRVRTRDGYLAPRGRVPSPPERAPPSVAVGALSNPTALRGVPLRVFAAAYKGAGRDAAVALAIEIDVTALGLVARDGVYAGDLEVTYTVTDARKQIYPGGRHPIALALTPATYERLSSAGLRVVSQLALPAGRYQIRVAAGSGTRSGSVIYDLMVPDFTGDALMLSGVSFASAAAAAAQTMRPEPAPQAQGRRRCNPPSCTVPLLDGAPSDQDPVRDALPGPPTTRREFARDDTVVLFAEVYRNVRRAPPHTLRLVTELRPPDGPPIVLTSEERPSTAETRPSGGHGFTTQLPLRDVPPGDYVLHVEATTDLQDGATASRRIPIQLR